MLPICVIGLVAACSEQRLQGDDKPVAGSDDVGDEGGDDGEEGTGDDGVPDDPVDPGPDDGTTDDGTTDDGTTDEEAPCDPEVADCDSECFCGKGKSPFEDDCGPEDCVESCTSGGGFWMNHPEDWPVEIEGLSLGDTCYLKEDVIAFLGLSSSVGDASITLGVNLVSARLNVAFGVGSTPDVDAAMLAADQWLRDHAAEDTIPAADGSYGTLPFGIHNATEAGIAAKAIDDVLAPYVGGLLTEVCDTVSEGRVTEATCVLEDATSDGAEAAPADTGG
ncbi:MAG: hypothetical protein ACOZNI_07520 [Myxococcota bacterium]